MVVSPPPFTHPNLLCSSFCPVGLASPWFPCATLGEIMGTAKQSHLGRGPLGGWPWVGLSLGSGDKGRKGAKLKHSLLLPDCGYNTTICSSSRCRDFATVTATSWTLSCEPAQALCPLGCFLSECFITATRKDTRTCLLHALCVTKMPLSRLSKDSQSIEKRDI